MFKDSFKLHPDEHILKYVRKHWIFFTIDIFGMAFLFLIPAVIVWTLQFSGYLPQFNLMGVSFESFLNILVYLWGLFCWLKLAEKFTDNVLDFWVITNKRIVESELTGLFNRKLSTLELEDIEDITIVDPGFLANYFGYGSLEVQTAGAQNEFKAENIENPAEVQRIMFDAKMKDEDEKKSFQRKSIEEVTHEIMREDIDPQFLNTVHPDSHIPHDQRRVHSDPVVEEVVSRKEVKEDNFDWAHEVTKEGEDDLNAKLEKIEAKYKKGLDNALKTDKGEE